MRGDSGLWCPEGSSSKARTLVGSNPARANCSFIPNFSDGQNESMGDSLERRALFNRRKL